MMKTAKLIASQFIESNCELHILSQKYSSYDFVDFFLFDIECTKDVTLWDTMVY